MRQAGVIAAAGIVALQTMVSRLAEDHSNARYLAHGLSRIPGITLITEEVQTNIMLFECSSVFPGPEFARQMDVRGVRLSYRGGQKFRAVTHRMVSAADLDEALHRIEQCRKEVG